MQTRHAEYHTGLPLLKACGGDTGGVERQSCACIFDSHPMDSRIVPVSVFPTVNAKMAKLCCDGTLVLIRNDA